MKRRTAVRLFFFVIFNGLYISRIIYILLYFKKSLLFVK